MSISMLSNVSSKHDWYKQTDSTRNRSVVPTNKSALGESVCSRVVDSSQTNPRNDVGLASKRSDIKEHKIDAPTHKHAHTLTDKWRFDGTNRHVTLNGEKVLYMTMKTTTTNEDIILDSFGA